MAECRKIGFSGAQGVLEGAVGEKQKHGEQMIFKHEVGKNDDAAECGGFLAFPIMWLTSTLTHEKAGMESNIKRGRKYTRN